MNRRAFIAAQVKVRLRDHTQVVTTDTAGAVYGKFEPEAGNPVLDVRVDATPMAEELSAFEAEIRAEYATSFVDAFAPTLAALSNYKEGRITTSALFEALEEGLAVQELVYMRECARCWLPRRTLLSVAWSKYRYGEFEDWAEKGDEFVHFLDETPYYYHIDGDALSEAVYKVVGYRGRSWTWPAWLEVSGKWYHDWCDAVRQRVKRSQLCQLVLR